MKKLAGLVVILAALVLGGYYGMGLVTERTLKKNVNLVNQSSGLHVDIQQYQRGWFTSTATFNWKLYIPERIVKNEDGQSTTVPAQDYAIDMPLTIYHGPVIFADSGVHFGLGYAYTDLTLPATYTQQFATLFTDESTKPHIDVSVLVNYLNKSRLRINIPTFKLISKENGGEFEWLGMMNDVTVSSNLSTVKGDMVIEGMRFAKDKTNAEVGKISSDYDLNQTKEGLYLGEANMSFPSLLITENDKKIFELENFDVHTGSDIDSGLFRSDFKTSLEKIIANGKTYGPGILAMSIKNLDADVLAQINNEVNKMQQGPEQQRQQALLALLPELPKLLSKGAELQVSEVSFVMPEGKVEGDLLVALPKGDLGNPFQLIQKIKGNGKLKIPSIVVKNMMIASVKQQMAKPDLQQAMVDQMQNAQDAQATPEPTAAPTATTAPPAEGNQVATTPALSNQSSDPQAPAVQTAANQSGSPEMEKNAAEQAELKLSGLVQAGLLTTQGDAYVIEVKLADGQLSVNGQPFNPAMMKF